MVTIELQPEHGYLLMVAAAVALEVRAMADHSLRVAELTRAPRSQFLAAGQAVMSLRKALFGKAFKERPGVVALFEEHKKSSAGERRAGVLHASARQPRLVTRRALC